MKWFFGFNEGAAQRFAEMVKVAVVTGQTQAPHLEPHCLYAMATATASLHCGFAVAG